MRVIILGAKGQLGQALVKEFELYHEVEAFDRNIMDGGYDITDKTYVDTFYSAKTKIKYSAFHGLDAIINAAAFTDTNAAEKRVVDAFTVNVDGAFNVARLASKFGAANVYIGTDFIFDGTIGFKEGYYEDAKPNPKSIYGTTKYNGEVITESFSKRNPYYIVRTSYLFGEYGENNIVEKILRLAKADRHGWGAVDSSFTPTYAGHLARNIRIMLENKLPSGIYHMSGQPIVTPYNFVKYILDKAGLRDTIVEEVKHAGIDKLDIFPQNSGLLSTCGILEMQWQAGVDEYLRKKGYDIK